MTRKPHPEFADYLIGDDGSVWSCRIIGHGGGIGTSYRKLKATTRKKNGYRTVVLRKPGDQEFHRYVHRLVLEAFVGPCPSGMEACHKDGDGSNNKLSNLRWDTRRNNHGDKKRHGTTAKGEKNPQAILTEDQVGIIKRRLLAGERASKIAKDFPGINVATFYMIKREKNWQWVEPRLPAEVRSRRRFN